MPKRLLWLLLAAVCFAAAPVSVQARNVALLIGNNAYEHTPPLGNPVSDTQLLARSAELAGFDEVIVANDLGGEAFQDVVRGFHKKARGADVAMIYYAGHGLESEGRNWLVPTDAKLQSAYDLPFEAIDLDLVLSALDGAQIRMVVLDACRDNPFDRSWQSKTRAVSRGLIGIEADDILVIYAAAPGQTAADGDGGNSPFAQSFAKRLPQPGLPLQLLGGMVRDDVLSATGGAQRPFVSASITGTPVYLGSPPADAMLVAPMNDRVALDEKELDALAWQGVLKADNLSAYTNYLKEFPAGQFAELASDNIARLSGKDRQNGTGFIMTALPDQSAVAEGQALPIDGIWTISTNGKRIRIESGRAIAVDPWTHAFVFKVEPGQVTMTGMSRVAAGHYKGQEILLPGPAVLTLADDGNLDVAVDMGLFPAKFRLIRQTIADVAAFEAEQALQE